MKYGSGMNLEPSATIFYADDYADDSTQCKNKHSVTCNEPR
jgi:hypothetical protein